VRSAARRRLERLDAAIGTVHADGFDREEHLRSVARMLDECCSCGAALDPAARRCRRCGRFTPHLG
jgi:hypothetical protein